jgi:multiple sugar transport system permease protein
LTEAKGIRETPRPRRAGSREDAIMKQVFLLPAVLLLITLVIFPLLWSLGISFTDIQRGGALREGGGLLGFGFELTLRNYARLLVDERFHIAARNTLFFVLLGVSIQYVVGLALALVLDQPFRGRNLARVVFLLPMMTTPVAVGYLGRMFFDPSRSPIAHLLRTVPGWFGADPIFVPWLTNPAYARWTIVLIESWQWTPFMTLLLLAGLQAIPRELYEAARVDGASALQIFRSIVFPLLLPISVTAILIRGLEIFKIIDIITVSTGGGPGSATESLTMYVFRTALTFGNYGYAAAIAFVLLALVVVFTTGFLGLARLITPRMS